jgi:imidazolonepropionase-like amidohydrolase
LFSSLCIDLVIMTPIMQKSSMCLSSLRRAIALVLLLLTPAFAGTYKFGVIWDGDKVWKDSCISTDGDRIQSVGPCSGTTVDFSRFTAIPGLIDAHTHMTYVLDNPVSQSGRNAAVVFLSQENARKTLETGVTTVRNLGAADYADIAMRDLINHGLMAGPRMFVSGYGLTISRSPTKTPGTADGVAEVLRVVREQVGAGADWVKMFGSTGSGRDVTGFETFTFEEMKAAVDAAHALGKRIAIHSYGPDGARDAVRAGADSLEHATDMDDATIAEMVRRKTFYVPTIDHNRYYADNWMKLKYPPEAVNDLNAYIQRNLDTARKAFRAGVRFAMGSDAVYTMFGENTRELEWFMKAGMTTEQALRTATTNGAELLNMEKSLGAIRPGYFADIVAVEGNPLEDIEAVVHKIRWVMKGGTVVVDKTNEKPKDVGLDQH